MPFHFPDEESLDREGLAAMQRRKLGLLFDRVLPSNAFYREKLGGLHFDARRDPLDQLPLTTRGEIQDDQRRYPPYGRNLTFDLARYNRYHQTSGTTGGPVRWLDTPESWEWCKQCWRIVFRAAGVTAADRIVFPFSFGPFLGFWAAFEAAASLGNLCLPAGGMSTSARLQYLLDNAATVVCCTPTYALHMAEAAAAEGIDLSRSAARLLIVAGEPGGNIPAARSRIETAWGAHVIDHAGMTEIGPSAVECVESPGGLHIIESEFIAEVLDPQTNRAVEVGQPGELVLTNLGRIGSPLIRYCTGDAVVMTRKRCACGRWFARLEGGIRGRVDDMLTIRGNNVFPSAVENILRSFSEVAEFRLCVAERGGMNELRVEVEPIPQTKPAGLGERIASAIRDRLHFRAEVDVVTAGTLPRFEMKAKRLVHRRT